jgi:hypothetical protein
VTGVSLSRKDLDAVAEASGIRELNLHGCHFQDPTLASLAKFRALESLSLGMSDASDDSVSVVAGMTELRSLYIHGTQITDRGLARLESLPNLQRMTVDRKFITCEALDSFSQRKPSVALQVFGPKCPAN